MKVKVRAQGELFEDSNVAVLQLPTLCQIVCLVCGLPSKIRVDAPAKLCAACMVDLVITKNGILSRLEALDRRTEAVRDAWSMALDAAGEEICARLDRAAEAGAAPPQAFAKTWAMRATDSSPLAVLLYAWEAMDAECASIERERAHEERALEEVEVAQNG